MRLSGTCERPLVVDHHEWSLLAISCLSGESGRSLPVTTVGQGQEH